MLWSLLPFGSGEAADLEDLLQILSRFLGDTVEAIAAHSEARAEAIPRRLQAIVELSAARRWARPTPE